MKVLMITGDKNTLVPGTAPYARVALQRSQVDVLDVVFWGRGALLAPLRVHGTYDVVTVQDPLWRGVVGLLVAKKLGARVNVQIHMDLDMLSWWKHVLTQIVLRHADSVRVVSDKIKKQVEGFGIRAPIHVLPVFIDVARFKNVQKKPHPRFVKTVLWIGRLEEEKRPQDALVALLEARRQGVEAGLVYVGSGSLEALVRAKAQQDGLAEWVELVGWQDPLPYLAMADVVLSTSPSEGYGASIVEALAAGVPVVALDIGVARQAGAIIASAGGLAEALVRVLQSDARGQLKISLPTHEEWAQQWKQTL